MSLKTVNTVLTSALVLFVLWFGTTYVVAPETIAPGFGLPSWPSGDGDGFLVVKGVRDVGGGLVLAALLLSGQRRGLGWAMIAASFMPFGDMANVLAHHGSAAVAFGIHCLTAVSMVAVGLLTLRETRGARAAATAPAPALVPAAR